MGRTDAPNVEENANNAAYKINDEAQQRHEVQHVFHVATRIAFALLQAPVLQIIVSPEAFVELPDFGEHAEHR